MQAFGAVRPTAGLVEIREAGEFIQRKRRMCNLSQVVPAEKPPGL